MKKKISLLIVFIGIALLGTGIYMFFSAGNKLEEAKVSFELVNQKYINNCLNDGCNEPDDLYAHLSTNSDIEIINKSLKTMNGNTDYYYDYVTTSNFEICADKKDSYAYRRSISSKYYNYINDDYITFAADRVEKDFCDNLITVLPIEVYVYDRVGEKILTQDEFQSKLGYSSKELDKIITDYLKSNFPDNIRDTYYGKALYYNSEGKLYVSFSWNEYDFMSMLLK